MDYANQENAPKTEGDGKLRYSPKIEHPAETLVECKRQHGTEQECSRKLGVTVVHSRPDSQNHNNKNFHAFILNFFQEPRLRLPATPSRLTRPPTPPQDHGSRTLRRLRRGKGNTTAGDTPRRRAGTHPAGSVRKICRSAKITAMQRNFFLAGLQ